MTIKLENKQLGVYKLLSFIGKGGMAQVWLANQTNLNREVAVKLIPEMTEAEDANHYGARFAREARAIAQLDHPSILPVIDYGSADGYLYLVTPYVRDGSLQKRLHQDTLTHAQAFDVFARVLDGVKFAHQHGIIHRDLKPGNILLYNDGRAVITDFGVAKIENDNLALTQAGVVLGSPQYMAPEQFMSHADYRSDLYSLGIILFELLTGRVPFSGTSPREIGMHHLHDPLPLPNLLVPLPLEMFLNKALQKRMEDRFSSADEMSIAFHKAIEYLAPKDLQAKPAQSSDNWERQSFPTKVMPLNLIQEQLAAGSPAAAKDAIPPQTVATGTVPIAKEAIPVESNTGLIIEENKEPPAPLRVAEPPANSEPPDRPTTAFVPLDYQPLNPPAPPPPSPIVAPVVEKATPILPPLRKKRSVIPILAALLLFLAFALAAVLVLVNSNSKNPTVGNAVTAAPSITTSTIASTSVATTSLVSATSVVAVAPGISNTAAIGTPAPVVTSPPIVAATELPVPPSATSSVVANTTVSATTKTLAPTVTTSAPSTATAASLKVSLKPANGTAARGTSTITDAGNGKVSITLNMLALGDGQHGFQIHEGTCQSEGPLRYQLDDFAANPDGTGSSSISLKADFAALTSGRYYFSVLNYNGNVFYTASCGEIHS